MEWNKGRKLKEWADLDAGRGETWDWLDGAEKQHAELTAIWLPLIVEMAAVLEYYADGTNFEAVDEGRNYHSEWVVEEFNRQNVCGQPAGQIASEMIANLERLLEQKERTP